MVVVASGVAEASEEAAAAAGVPGFYSLDLHIQTFQDLYLMIDLAAAGYLKV